MNNCGHNCGHNMSDYEIMPIDTLLSQYNRYPFACYEEAVENLKEKALKPGEFGVAYYWDETNICGISAIFAVGNLKSGANQIFKNAKQLEELGGELIVKMAKHHEAISDCINSINMANKNYGNIYQMVKDCEEYAKVLSTKIQPIEWINIDEYNEDL